MPRSQSPNQRRSNASRARWLAAYRRAARDSIYSLIILVPLVIGFELAAAWLRPIGAPSPRLIAPGAIRDLFGWLGASGAWLPAITMCGVLIGMQLSRATASKPRAAVALLSIAEGAALALPLALVSVALLGRGSAADVAGITAYRAVLAIGAALYEEFVFRLVLISALLFLFRDLMRLKQSGAAALSVAVAATVFSAAHFPPAGSMAFGWPEFFFYVSAGAYLSVLFLARGLPIAVVCHAAYNIAMLIWR
ncbi:MAG: CPBP family intramembrane metalloprotease [Phycisphaerales bacterium]|nr:CPBP family intramembrane metalloprotease [Phycisphaerales bacterium]